MIRQLVLAALLLTAPAARAEDGGVRGDAGAAVAEARQLVEQALAHPEQRVEAERALQALGDAAVPALIEAKARRDPSASKWATGVMEGMGKKSAADAVQTHDPELLGAILLTYARTHDRDAVDAVMAFANSDRVPIRTAAREALLTYGVLAVAKMRESYQNLTGRPLPDDWDPVRVANELFRALDRSSSQEVYAVLDQALAQAREAGDDAARLEPAVKELDRVLARQPLIDRRVEIIPVYVRFAQLRADHDRPLALDYLRRAGRLDPQGARQGQIQSQILTLEAEELLARGIVDRAALDRAASLDPGNQRPRAVLASLEAAAEVRERRLHAWIGAAIALLLAMVTTILLAGRSRET